MERNYILELAVKESDLITIKHYELFRCVPLYKFTVKLYFDSYEQHENFVKAVRSEFIDSYTKTLAESFYTVKSRDGKLKSSLGNLIFTFPKGRVGIIAIGGHDDYYGDVIYDLESSTKEIEMYLDIRGEEEDVCKDLIDKLFIQHDIVTKHKEEDAMVKVEVITPANHGSLRSQPFSIKAIPNLDIALNYGEEFLPKNKIIVDRLNTGKKGLVILNGEPGTGKSTYIKYLLSHVKKSFCLLAVSDAESINSPTFNKFLTDNTNKIIVIEDAEKLVVSREDNENSAIAGILNLSDGLTSELFNVMIILTFNTSRQNIDPALLRKGRLICEHEFQKIPKDRAKLMLKKIHNIDIEEEGVAKDFTLTDIYNFNEYKAEEKRKLVIGF
jgi:hypothetical protein